MKSQRKHKPSRVRMDRTVYVENLPYYLDETIVSEIFSQVGTVESVRLLFEEETGLPRGAGFVELDTEEEAQMAMTCFDEARIAGHTLKVRGAGPRTVAAHRLKSEAEGKKRLPV
jgi:RNA recognition motif-containing protein